MNKLRTGLDEIVAHIEPFDETEARDRRQVRRWIAEGRSLYRLSAPDSPPQHLVSYFVLVDHPRRSLLLVDHVKAGLWLPTGGHVEPGEEPYDTVQRELAEELGTRAAMVASVATMPLMITTTSTRGPRSHTDISLWYVVAGDEKMWLDPDKREFRGHKWAKFSEVWDTPIEELDPAMHRFLRKLESKLPV